MRLSNALIPLALACSALICISATQDTRRERPLDHEVETWQDFGRMAALIHALPAWNDQDDLTKEEWRSIADLACALQQLRDSEIEALLITYMNVYQAKGDRTDGGRTKPLLLLRMMFDTAQRTPMATDKHGRQWRERGYQPCGGFQWSEVHVDSLWSVDALPIAWTNGQPSLAAKRVRAVGGNGPPIHSYQPHLDFRYLRDMYEKRDLSALAGAKTIKWQDLAKAANLFADDPTMNP